jgi:hypothetical protein
MIGSAAVKSIDDAPYALVGATLGAVGFLLGNLVLNYGSWLVGAFILGAVLGFVAGILALRSKKLSPFATVGEMKLAIKRESEKS